MRYRRCLVPASAWYEWRRHGRTRTPFLVRRRDGAAMALAGLWETWSAADGSEIDTAAIVTTAANGSLAAIDERMPVVVAPADFDAWLDTPSTPLKEATRLVRPAPDALFEMVAIGPHVGNPRHEGPHVQEPACEPPLPRRDAPGAGVVQATRAGRAPCSSRCGNGGRATCRGGGTARKPSAGTICRHSTRQIPARSGSITTPHRG